MSSAPPQKRRQNLPRVMVAAHMDEIGFMATGFTAWLIHFPASAAWATTSCQVARQNRR
jgi:hypothetical protein